MHPTSMRNKVKYGVFDGKTMRNTILKIILIVYPISLLPFMINE